MDRYNRKRAHKESADKLSSILPKSGALASIRPPCITRCVKVSRKKHPSMVNTQGISGIVARMREELPVRRI